MSSTQMYKYLSRTLDGAQDCLPGISNRGVCPGAACWHGWLPHDLACLVPDEKRRAFFSNGDRTWNNWRLTMEPFNPPLPDESAHLRRLCASEVRVVCGGGGGRQDANP